jgi:hypothetical protein
MFGDSFPHIKWQLAGSTDLAGQESRSEAQVDDCPFQIRARVLSHCRTMLPKKLSFDVERLLDYLHGAFGAFGAQRNVLSRSAREFCRIVARCSQQSLVLTLSGCLIICIGDVIDTSEHFKSNIHWRWPIVIF